MAGNPVDTQSANSEAFIGSREDAENKYGQNGYHGPSSDITSKGDKTRMNRDYGLPADPSAATGDWQTRAVKAEQYPAHPGMKPRTSPEVMPDHPIRRASQRITGKSFQRR